MDGAGTDFEAMYAEYSPRIRRYLARLLGPGEADDAAQDVFVKASRALDQFRGESSLATWLYRIATNPAADRARGPEYRASLRTSEIDDAEPGCASLASHELSAERQAIRDEMSGCVQSVLAELPEAYRTVLALSEMEDLKDREIAEVLGITREAVKIRLHRARAALRERLEARCSFYRDPDNTLVCDSKTDDRCLSSSGTPIVQLLARRSKE